MTEQEEVDLLPIFKERMHIFHDSEDDNLKAIIEGSKSEIKRMTGSDDLNIIGIRELILERSRYVYNDSVEFFEDNFQAQILGMSAVISETEVTGDESVSTPEDK